MYDVFSDPHLSKLAYALQVYSSDLNESGLDIQTTLNFIRAHIETYICTKLEDGLPKYEVMKHLRELDRNGGSKDEHTVGYSEPELPLLFSKDTVYHASLCAFFISQTYPKMTACRCVDTHSRKSLYQCLINIRYL